MQKIWFSLSLFILSNGVMFAGAGLVFAEAGTMAESPSSQQANRAAYLDPEQKKQKALSETLKAHETVWLDVNYPEIAEPRKVLAVASPSLTAENKGAVLLIHDKEQHADWPEIIHPLRTHLPKHGWFTLSVNLPDETRIQQPERAIEAKTYDQLTLNDGLKKSLESGVRNRVESDIVQGSDQSEGDESNVEKLSAEQDAEDTESVDIDLAAAQKKPDLNKIPYNIRALKHIEKAYEHLKTESYQKIVMLAYGQSAELAIQYLKAHQGDMSASGFAIILIEPSIPEAYLLDLSEWIGKDFQAPILDIINKNDLQANQDAEYRRLSVLRAGGNQYKQLFLTMHNNDIFDENISRRIRAWLEATGKP